MPGIVTATGGLAFCKCIWQSTLQCNRKLLMMINNPKNDTLYTFKDSFDIKQLESLSKFIENSKMKHEKFRRKIDGKDNVELEFIFFLFFDGKLFNYMGNFALPSND